MFLERHPRMRQLVVLSFFAALLAHPAIHSVGSIGGTAPAIVVENDSDSANAATHNPCDLCKVSGHIVVAVNGLVVALAPSSDSPLSGALSYSSFAAPDVLSCRAPPQTIA